MGDRNQKKKKEESLQDTEYRPVNWKKLLLSPKYIPWHILGIAIAVITVLITIHHDQVVDKLRPFGEKVRDIPAGWLIPIAILIVISFPPLFGHEIIALLCGVIYGLWIGFGIVAAGTFFGEVGTWFAFKYALRRRAQKLERTNLNYGALARLTRDGGFWIVLVIRFSVIPSHFSTAVFSTCDVNFWYFAIATFLTLPKQIILVYFGVLLVQESGSDLIKDVVLGITFLITIVLAVWIWFKMKTIKKILLDEQAARKANLEMERLKEAEAAAQRPQRDFAYGEQAPNPGPPQYSQNEESYDESASLRAPPYPQDPMPYDGRGHFDMPSYPPNHRRYDEAPNLGPTHHPQNFI